MRFARPLLEGTTGGTGISGTTDEGASGARARAGRELVEKLRGGNFNCGRLSVVTRPDSLTFAYRPIHIGKNDGPKGRNAGAAHASGRDHRGCHQRSREEPPTSPGRLPGDARDGTRQRRIGGPRNEVFVPCSHRACTVDVAPHEVRDAQRRARFERPIEQALLRLGELATARPRQEVLGGFAVLEETHALPPNTSSSASSPCTRVRSFSSAARSRLRTVLTGVDIARAVSSTVYPSNICNASTSA